jgi:outer membrane protein TolC
VVKYQRNQLLPQLDVVGTAGYAASGKDLNDAADQIRGRDNPFWSGALQMTMPLGNTLARNNYKAAKSTKEQIAAQLKQLEQSILINIENAIAVAKTDFEQVSATREARLYAEEALAAEEKKLESGKSTTFDVLSLQSKLTSARSDEISALRQYNNDLAQLALAEGSTLERRHVKIMPKNDK